MLGLVAYLVKLTEHFGWGKIGVRSAPHTGGLFSGKWPAGYWCPDAGTERRA